MTQIFVYIRKNHLTIIYFLNNFQRIISKYVAYALWYCWQLSNPRISQEPDYHIYGCMWPICTRRMIWKWVGRVHGYGMIKIWKKEVNLGGSKWVKWPFKRVWSLDHMLAAVHRWLLTQVEATNTLKPYEAINIILQNHIPRCETLKSFLRR